MVEGVCPRFKSSSSPSCPLLRPFGVLPPKHLICLIVARVRGGAARGRGGRGVYGVNISYDLYHISRRFCSLRHVSEIQVGVLVSQCGACNPPYPTTISIVILWC